MRAFLFIASLLILGQTGTVRAECFSEADQVSTIECTNGVQADVLKKSAEAQTTADVCKLVQTAYSDSLACFPSCLNDLPSKDSTCAMLNRQFTLTVKNIPDCAPPECKFGGGLSGGAIAGIIVGVLVVLGIIGGVMYYRMKQNQSAANGKAGQVASTAQP